MNGLRRGALGMLECVEDGGFRCRLPLPWLDCPEASCILLGASSRGYLPVAKQPGESLGYHLRLSGSQQWLPVGTCVSLAAATANLRDKV